MDKSKLKDIKNVQKDLNVEVRRSLKYRQAVNLYDSDPTTIDCLEASLRLLHGSAQVILQHAQRLTQMTTQLGNGFIEREPDALLLDLDDPEGVMLGRVTMHPNGPHEAIAEEVADNN